MKICGLNLKKPQIREITILLEDNQRFVELSKGISIKMETMVTQLTVGDMVFVNLQSIGGDDDERTNELLW